MVGDVLISTVSYLVRRNVYSDSDVDVFIVPLQSQIGLMNLYENLKKDSLIKTIIKGSGS